MEFYYHEHDRDVLILAADGGLNANTAETFVKQLEALVDAGVNRIIVDCSNLQYISSYGIGVLVRLHNRLVKHGGHVKIASPPGKVLQALAIVRLAQMFEIYPDLEQARLAFREKDGG